MNRHPDPNNWNPNQYCQPYLNYRPRAPVSQSLGPSTNSQQQQIHPHGIPNIVNNQMVDSEILDSRFNVPVKTSFPDQKSWPRPMFVHGVAFEERGSTTCIDRYDEKRYMGKESNKATQSLSNKNQQFIQTFNRADYKMDQLHGNHTEGSMFDAQCDQRPCVNNLQSLNSSWNEKQLQFTHLNPKRPFSPQIPNKNPQYFQGRNELNFVPNIQNCTDSVITKSNSTISQFKELQVPDSHQMELSQYSVNKHDGARITTELYQQQYASDSNFKDSTNKANMKSLDYQTDKLSNFEYQNQHHEFDGQSWKKIDLPHLPFDKVDTRDCSNLETNEPTCNKGETSRLKDRNWISQWINKKRLESRKQNLSNSLARITVSQAKQLLCEALLLKDELTKMSENLQPSNQKVQPRQEEFYKVKKRLMEIKKTLTDKPTLETLQAKLKAINKKRGRQNRKRKVLNEEKLKAEEERVLAHKRLEQWHENILLRNIQAERDKEIKASADEILSEVRRKLTEAKKSIDLLSAIRKLRKVKKEKAMRKGVTIPQEIDSAFESRLDNALHLMRKQQKTYEDERKTLEVMLETEQEVNEEQEKEKQKIQIGKKEKQLEKNIRKYLFGSEETLAADHPFLPYRQYYEIGNQSLEGLFKVRQEWDMYCVPEGTTGGSRIPPNWLEPADSSSSVWASALEDNSI